MNVVDLFAGPGGWDLAAEALGWKPLGIEWDEAACATREAAGLRTLRADVGALDPREVLADYFVASCERCGGFGALDPMGGPAHHVSAAATAPCPACRLDGLIASPPCQAFSMAGNGEGRKAISGLLAATRTLGTSRAWSSSQLDALCDDDRAHLVLEPLRWALELRPRWVALEQVEPVLPLWDATAERLRAEGYSAWTGVVSAERFGVPQTRRRAILLASLDRDVAEPVATHRRYVAPRRRDEATLGLFDLPDPERIELPEEQHLEPWVSMAEALGWSGGDVGFPRRADGGAVTEDGYRERDTRPVSEPAFALTEKTRSWLRLRPSGQVNATERDADEPAPTLAFGHDAASCRWVIRTGNFTSPGNFAELEDGRSEPYERAASEPAPTIRGGRVPSWVEEGGTMRPPNAHRGEHLSADGWPETRPATTLAGDARVFPPGGHIANDGRDNSRMVGRPENAVRVSIAEALVLQSFPPDYPVQGTKTKQFEQVGNAVPPLMALRVLEAVAPAR